MSSQHLHLVESIEFRKKQCYFLSTALGYGAILNQRSHVLTSEMVLKIIQVLRVESYFQQSTLS